MEIQFTQNTKEDIKELISSIIEELKILTIEEYVDFYEDLIIRITDSDEFQCELAFNSCILLSEKAIEAIWLICYAHLTFYTLVCQGTKADGQIIQLNDEDWKIPKEMLSIATAFLSKNESLIFSNSYPRTFNKNTQLAKVFKYALMFFISHELFHVKYNGIYENLIEEEDQCDKSALDLILKTIDSDDMEFKSHGVCLGLMILNVYGVHTNNFDGTSHPYTYDRLIDNLAIHFDSENKIWGLAVAIFALHMTEKDIQQPKIEFENFYDCILEYKKILKTNTSN
jgi:hypothetical protein